MSNEFGLLWFDNDKKKDWRQKVKDATKRYQEKFWVKATHCYINADALSDETVELEGRFVEEVEGIRVYTKDSVLSHHFFAFHLVEPAPANKPKPQESGQLTLF